MFGTNLLNLFSNEPSKKPTLFQDLHERIRSIGFATKNRYLVRLIPNQQLLASQSGTAFSWNPSVQKRLALACDSASIPSKMLSTKEAKNYGPGFKVPYNMSVDSLSLNFYVGTDMFERYFFEQWMNGIQNPLTYDLNYYDEYVSTIEIFSLPKSIDTWEDIIGNADSIFKITLHEAYPYKLDPISLASSETGIMTFGVDFNYRYYEINTDIADQIAQSEILFTDENGNPKMSILDKLMDNSNEIVTSATSGIFFLKSLFS